MEIIAGQVYKHSKSGNLYKIIAVAMHSETLEDLVVYEALYDNPKTKYWVRPVGMFFEVVEINGEQKPRFELVENA